MLKRFFEERRYQAEGVYYFFMFAFMPLLAVWESRGLPVVFVAVFAFSFPMLLWFETEARANLFRLSRNAVIIIAAVVILGVLNLLVSINPALSAWEMMTKLPVILCIAGFLWSSRFLDTQRTLFYLTVGLMVALPLILWLLETKGAPFEFLEERYAHPAKLNRSAVVCAVWLSLVLAIHASGKVGWSGMGQALVLMSFGFFVFSQSNSQSAILYLLLFAVMLTVFLFAPLVQRWVKLGLLVLLGSIPFVIYLPTTAALLELDYSVLNSLLIQSSAEVRLQFWKSFAHVINHRPLLGWGLGTETEILKLVQSGADQKLKLAARHPHSMPVQLWVNMGAAGAVFFMFLFWRVARRIERFPLIPSAVAMAIFCALIFLWSTSHGAWQTWWFVVLAIPAGVLMAVAQSSTDEEWTTS